LHRTDKKCSLAWRHNAQHSGK